MIEAKVYKESSGNYQIQFKYKGRGFYAKVTHMSQGLKYKICIDGTDKYIEGEEKEIDNIDDLYPVLT